MKQKILNYIFKHYQGEIYDFIVLQFIGQVPDTVREPVLDFLADKRVLFEKFLSIQAYRIQKERIMSKKSPDFYDGCLVIIKAFLVAVNQRVIKRTTVATTIDTEKQTKDELANVGEFLKGFTQMKFMKEE